MTEGTKDVTTAQERTDPLSTDTVLIVNSMTQEVNQMPLNKLGESMAGQTKVAPADFEDFFGL